MPSKIKVNVKISKVAQGIIDDPGTYLVRFPLNLLPVRWLLNMRAIDILDRALELREPRPIKAGDPVARNARGEVVPLGDISLKSTPPGPSELELERRWFGPVDLSGLDKLRKRYRIEGVDAFGCDTGRRRYRVECLECGQLLHEATTGPGPRIEQHEQEGCCK